MKNVALCKALTVGAVALVLACCSLFSGKPTISWKNYDFDDGLGNQATAKTFIGTPFDSGCPIAYFAIRQGAKGKEIWGSSTVLIRSTDLGASWQIVEDRGQLSEYLRILAEPSGAIWAANRCSIWASRDGGATWTDVYDGPPGLGCAGWNGMSLRDGTLWAVGGAGIVVAIDTTSFGVTEVSRPLYASCCILAASNGRILLGASEGLFESTDGGNTFSRMTDLPNFVTLCEDAGSIWALGNGEILRLSLSGTVLWRSSSAGLPGFHTLTSSGGLVYALWEEGGSAGVSIIDPSDSYAVKSIELGGRISGAGLTGGIHVDGDGYLYVGLAGRIMIHEPGAPDDVWLERPFGVSSVKLIQSRGGETWAGLDGNGVARYDPATDSWVTLGTRLCGNLVAAVESILILENGTVFLGGGGTEVARTDDSGRTFQFLRYEPGSLAIEARHMEARSDGAIVLKAPIFVERSAWEARLYISTDNGASWSCAGTICSDPQGPCFGDLVADTYRQCLWVVHTDGLQRGNLDGQDWTLVPEMYPWGELCLDANGRLWALASGPLGTGIYFLDDSEAWRMKTLPVNGDVNCKSGIHVDNDGDIWLGTDHGLYYGPAGGQSWYIYGKADGLPSEIINSVFVEGQGSDRIIWIGTQVGASRGFLPGS